MKTFTHTFRDQSGFTLIEVLITVLVVSIGLLGLAGLQISGLRANMGSEVRSNAAILANNIAERMRANQLGVHNTDATEDNQYANLDTGTYTGPAPAENTCEINQPTLTCSNYTDGVDADGDADSSVDIADTCTASEMAAHDAWVWACGTPTANGVVQGGVTNILMDGFGTVVCNDLASAGADGDACSPGSPHTITVGWSVPNPDYSNDGNPADNPDMKITRSYTLVITP